MYIQAKKEHMRVIRTKNGVEIKMTEEEALFLLGWTDTPNEHTMRRAPHHWRVGHEIKEKLIKALAIKVEKAIEV